MSTTYRVKALNILRRSIASINMAADFLQRTERTSPKAKEIRLIARDLNFIRREILAINHSEEKEK